MIKQFELYTFLEVRQMSTFADMFETVEVTKMRFAPVYRKSSSDFPSSAIEIQNQVIWAPCIPRVDNGPIFATQTRVVHSLFSTNITILLKKPSENYKEKYK